MLKGRKVYHLNIGNPDLPTPAIAIDAMKNLSLKTISYGHSAGDESFRRKMAAYYNHIGINVDYNEILVTSGGSEALLFGMISCMDTDEEAIVPEPFYDLI